MFTVSVEDTGSHPDSVLSQIKKCLRSCLRSEPASVDELRARLAARLCAPHIMGALYRFMWVDTVGSRDTRGQNYFIIIATNLEDGWGRGKPVLAWAVRRRTLASLKEMCIETIKDNLSTKDEVEELGLPRSLEDNLCSLFEKTL